MTKKKMVIFASGRGSNAIALHDAVEDGKINAEIKALVCDIPGAPVMDRAKEWGVPVILADRKSFDSKAAFEKYILDAIEPYQADVICLAGFMRLLSGDFISHYEHKMLNIHPALLPSFRGLHAQRQAVEAGVWLHGPFRRTRHGRRPDHLAVGRAGLRRRYGRHAGCPDPHQGTSDVCQSGSALLR